jgi:hypothetical protein
VTFFGSLLIVALLLVGGPYLAITLYYLADTWFRYHWIETVTLGALFILAKILAWTLVPEGKYLPDIKGFVVWIRRAASILGIAWLVVPLGLTMWTFFCSPPLEVAVQKMHARWDGWYSKEHFLYNPDDFKGSGEEGVKLLLQEISSPDTKLALVVESLRATGPSGEKALQTEGAKRLLQEISNPDANLEKLAESLKEIGASADTLFAEGSPLLRKRLQDDDKSFPAILRFCVIIGEPVFPVMREMANFKDPRSGLVLEAIAKMAPGTPGIEQFTPEIIQHCFYHEDVWHYWVPAILDKHGGALEWGLRNFVPPDRFEAEGRRTALRLIEIPRRRFASAGDIPNFQPEARERKFWILGNLPPEPKYY